MVDLPFLCIQGFFISFLDHDNASCDRYVLLLLDECSLNDPDELSSERPADDQSSKRLLLLLLP
jgi:hypothetical protein